MVQCFFRPFAVKKLRTKIPFGGVNFWSILNFVTALYPVSFFSRSIIQLTELGYKYINVDVDPTNSAALPLYKRVGFIRSRQAYIDYDGYLELRSYLPLIIQFLKKGYHVVDLDDSLVDSGWRSLLSAKDIRSFDNDTFDLYGMETFRYEMKFGQDVITYFHTQTEWSLLDRQLLSVPPRCSCRI